MVFIAIKLTAFFTKMTLLTLVPYTPAEIFVEGIESPENLVEFNKEGMETVFLNLRKTPRIPSVISAGMPPVMLNQEAYQILAESKIRIVIAI